MKRGDLVAVTFLDHVESPKGARAERFTVYGRIIAIDTRAVVIGSWVYSARSRRCDDNTTTYTILRSCIERVDKLSATKLDT